MNDEIPVDEWEVRNKALTDMYAEVPQTAKAFNARKVTMKSVRLAVENNETLASTQAGLASKAFLAAWDAAQVQTEYKLGGQDDANVRFALLDLIEQLVKQYPESHSVMNRVFKPAVKSNGEDRLATVLSRMDPNKGKGLEPEEALP